MQSAAINLYFIIIIKDQFHSMRLNANEFGKTNWNSTCLQLHPYLITHHPKEQDHFNNTLNKNVCSKKLNAFEHTEHWTLNIHIHVKLNPSFCPILWRLNNLWMPNILFNESFAQSKSVGYWYGYALHRRLRSCFEKGSTVRDFGTILVWCWCECKNGKQSEQVTRKKRPYFVVPQTTVSLFCFVLFLCLENLCLRHSLDYYYKCRKQT